MVPQLVPQLVPQMVPQLVPQLVPQNDLNPNYLEDRGRMRLELISEMTMEELC